MTGTTENYVHRGLIPRIISQLYKEIANKTQMAITVRISYLEIYNEQMYDLLSSLNDDDTYHGALKIIDENIGIYIYIYINIYIIKSLKLFSFIIL